MYKRQVLHRATFRSEKQSRGAVPNISRDLQNIPTFLASEQMMDSREALRPKRAYNYVISSYNHITLLFTITVFPMGKHCSWHCYVVKCEAYYLIKIHFWINKFQKKLPVHFFLVLIIHYTHTYIHTHTYIYIYCLLYTSRCV